ncbi:phosphopantetheine-binding protein [Variovorax sp. 375MFSha3.1]|uniref:Acyl carrier protein n=1 Tax=Variovorax guangxiensis TaxID=1775474 RepID=A0A433MFH3_9BURK|nr:phosphopantetheine-binding protein [Variovorax guangxiensis]MBB4222398.1 acyl carrier protein [Variovorax guangxiensis]RUR66689.1 acyl carrier protein [Variovorax guangxiensis]
MSSSDLSSPTFNSIAAILQTDFRVDPAAISPATALTDLGLDSLALMEFVFAVEDAFHLRIPEERLDPREAGITLQRLCEVIDAESAGAVAAQPAEATA